jgi:hypothetical protein
VSDPLRKVQIGEPFRPSAPSWNAFVDAARAEQQRQLDRIAGQPSTYRDPDIVRVKNETGADLARFSVVGLGDPIFLPDVADTRATQGFLQEVTFRAELPTVNSKIAILLEPALEDRVVKAQLSGVIHCRVDIQNDGHAYAGPATGVTGRLVSKGFGPFEILWRETDESSYAYDDGEMWCIVRFGTGRPSNAAFVATDPIPMADSPVEPGIGPATRWYRNRLTNLYEPSDPAEVESVLNWSTTATFPANRLFMASDVDGDWVATLLLCGAQSTEPYD